jgi:hypothetical protein
MSGSLHSEEPGAAQKRDPILVFIVHGTLTKNLPSNPRIRRSLPKVGESMKVAKQAADWLYTNVT